MDTYTAEDHAHHILNAAFGDNVYLSLKEWEEAKSKVGRYLKDKFEEKYPTEEEV